jgi:hypothetical protein
VARLSEWFLSFTAFAFPDLDIFRFGRQESEEYAKASHEMMEERLEGAKKTEEHSS